MIILDRIPVFVAVADELSFSRAAEKLGRTQSAVSQSIALLEEELAIRLFNRNGHKIRLTEPGKLLLDQSRFSLGHMEKALTQIREWKGLERGSLRIGSSLSSAEYLLPPVLKSFHDRYRDIDLSLTGILSENAPEIVNRGEIDIAIGILPKREIHELTSIALIGRRDVLISCEELSPREDDPHFEKLLAHQPLILAGKGMQSRIRMEKMFEYWETSPRIVLECDDIEVIKKMVISGLGISILPEMSVKGEMERRELFGLPTGETQPANTIGLLMLPETADLPVSLAFVSMIKKHLSTS